MNINYTLTNRYNTWELEVRLEGFKDDNYSGYLNQEADVMCLGCPGDQVHDIEDSFTPYKFNNLQDAHEAINNIESEKRNIINTYLLNRELSWVA